MCPLGARPAPLGLSFSSLRRGRGLSAAQRVPVSDSGRGAVRGQVSQPGHALPFPLAFPETSGFLVIKNPLSR